MLCDDGIDANALAVLGGHELFEIVVEILEDEEKDGGARAGLRMDDFIETDDVGGLE